MITPEQIAKSNTEHAHQAAVFCWCSTHLEEYPELEWYHAIPNGGERDIITAGKLKAEGVKSGVSDTFLPVKRGEYSGLYIEIKKPGKINQVSERQAAFGVFVQSQGFAFVVLDHWKLVVKTLIEYLNYKG